MQQGAVMALARLTSNLPLERLLPSRYLPLWEKQLAFEKDRAARKERDREAAERAKKHKKKAPTLQVPGPLPNHACRALGRKGHIAYIRAGIERGGRAPRIGTLGV